MCDEVFSFVWLIFNAEPKTGQNNRQFNVKFNCVFPIPFWPLRCTLYNCTDAQKNETKEPSAKLSVQCTLNFMHVFVIVKTNRKPKPNQIESLYSAISLLEWNILSLVRLNLKFILIFRIYLSIRKSFRCCAVQKLRDSRENGCVKIEIIRIALARCQCVELQNMTISEMYIFAMSRFTNYSIVELQFWTARTKESLFRFSSISFGFCCNWKKKKKTNIKKYWTVHEAESSCCCLVGFFAMLLRWLQNRKITFWTMKRTEQNAMNLKWSNEFRRQKPLLFSSNWTVSLRCEFRGK